MNQPTGQTAFRQPAPQHVLEGVGVPSNATLADILAETETRRVNSVIEQAKIGFKSKYLPKHIQNEDQAIAIALAGQELGLPPMTAFREIYFFDGRVVLSAQLLRALAHRRVEGFRLDIVKTTEAGCWVVASRPSMSEPAKFSFTIEDATRAGLTSKDNWRKYPAAMCIARATAMAIRAIAPEAALGITTKEERADGVQFEVDVTPEGLDVTPVAGPQPSRVDALKEQLRAQQAAAPPPAPAPTPIDKKAQRAAPPAGFTAEDPAAPPAGFPSTKKATKPKPEEKAAPAAQEPPKPADPLDCSKRAEGETFEYAGDQYVVRKTAMGLVPELIGSGHGEPPAREPGQD